MFNGKIIVVTGASRGIGEATARDLLAHGATVVAAARSLDKLSALQKEFGDRCLPVACDVTDRAQVQSLHDETIKRFGRVDVLINNAGVMPLSYMKSCHIEEWDQMIDVNLKGALYAIGIFLPTLRQQRSGHIVNVGSVASRRVFPGGAVYCATKFGLRAVSEGLRRELDPKENIRVTMIEPGAVATELAMATTDKEYLETSEFNVEKVLEPADVARSIRYAIEQPPHVNIEELMLMPKDQTQ